MNWGNWILTTFILFALFVAALVTVCVRQDVSLVTKEYYKEELAYQEQFERKQNAGELNVKPVLSITSGKFLEVQYDKLNEISSGKVKLFRPSDAALDQDFIIQTTADSVQRFPLSMVKKGLYKARMQWTMDGKEYYIEKVIVL